MRLARVHLRPLRLAAAVALCCAVAVAGCGFGPGESSPGTATLTVTREFGTVPMVEASEENPAETETVARFLDREAEIETAYSGNFVTSIEGVESTSGGSSMEDWFFYVNGYLSPVGLAEAEVRPGDRVWWDYREWSGSATVPAVVGSFPEPFLHGNLDEQVPTAIDCRAEVSVCDGVSERLEDAGAEIVEPGGDVDAIRVLVGEIGEIGDDPAVRLLRRGPETSGVYARPVSCGGDTWLAVLDAFDQPAVSLESFGLVAATQRADRQPIWIVTGSNPSELDAAVGALEEGALADRYALALSGGAPQGVPSGPTDPELGACG